MSRPAGWQLGWWQLGIYGLPGLPLAALGLPLAVYLPQFYEAMPTLGVGTVGTLFVIARILDVLSDPLVGLASDRWPTRFGRRRPWMAVGTPVLMLSAWYLFVPGTAVSALYLLFWLSLAYLGWTLIYLPYTSLGAELSSDYNERSRITASREGFFALGTLVAILLPALLHKPGAPADAGLQAIASFLLLGLPIAVALFLWRLPEPPYKPPRRTPWREGWRLLKANRAFLRLLVAYMLNGAANGLPAVLFLYYVTAILGASNAVGGHLPHHLFLIRHYRLAAVVMGWSWLVQTPAVVRLHVVGERSVHLYPDVG